jgi:hypothetical protein
MRSAVRTVFPRGVIGRTSITSQTDHSPIRTRYMYDLILTYGTGCTMQCFVHGLCICIAVLTSVPFATGNGTRYHSFIFI